MEAFVIPAQTAFLLISAPPLPDLGALGARYRLAAQVASLAAATDWLARHDVPLVLLQLRPEDDPKAAARALVKPGRRIAVWGRPGADLIGIGFDGVLDAATPGAALPATLDLIMAGLQLVGTGIALAHQRRRLTDHSPPGLSARERDLLCGLLRGNTNREMGMQLGVEDRAVKRYLAQLYRKIGVGNRTQAALWARSQGINAGGAPARAGPG